MFGDETDPKAKKKKKPTLLSEKMGLDRGSDYDAPPAPAAQPGLFPGSAAMALNEQDNSSVSGKVEEKLKKRKGAPIGR
jgi:hypothetical protein